MNRLDLPLGRAQWAATEAAAAAITEPFRGLYAEQRFEHVQPVRLQPGVPARLRRPYATSVSYLDWGARDAPVVVCTGGVANAAMRFSFLARALAAHHRVVCMDWLGRGRSGWLADDREYGLLTYVEQLRQLLDHLACPRATLLGSSMGGSVAMAFAAAHPRRVERLVLNDVGPAIPRARRAQRAQALARFYVFRTPADLLRRVGAAHKHDGPIDDALRLFLAWHQTRWSDENDGRVYRHDPRAMLAYQRDAARSVDQWAEWETIACPVLLLHGVLSDALSPRTIARMQRARPLSVAHIPHTGHAPVLAAPAQIAAIDAWLRDADPAARELTIE